MPRLRVVTSTFCLALVLVLCIPQGALVEAESLPYLQEGLTLKYEQRYAWTHPNWGNGEFGFSRDTTIRVLDIDQSNDKIRMKYESSAVVTFPPGTKSSRIEGVNLDGSKPVFKSSGDAGKRLWSVNSTIVLSGRTVVSIEGDRVDFVWLRAEGNYGTWTDGSPWTYCYDWKWTDFPLGYPAWFFLYPGMSPGDRVQGYWKGLQNGAPRMKDSSFSITGTAIQSSPLGDREVLVAEEREATSLEAGAWQFETRTLWDRKTGILLYYEGSGTNPRGEGKENTKDQVRLVDISPLPIATETTITHTATSTSAASTVQAREARLQVPYLSQGNEPICYATSITMVLRYFGKHAELGDVVRQVGVYPNVTQRWIDELAKDNGLIFKYYRTGSAWYQFPRIDGSMDISYIKVHIDHGIPVMAGQRYSLSNPSGHVRVVTGYNDQMQVLYINDPANAYVGQMSYDEFQELWKFSGSAINEAYVLYPSKAWQSTTYTTQLTTQVQSSQFTTSQTTTSIIETTRVLSTETSIIHTGEPLSTEVGPPTVPVELLAVGGIISILLAVAVVFMMRRKK